VKHTEQTDTLLRALEQVNAIDLDKLYASGINVTVSSYTEDKPDHVECVTVHAEDFGPVKVALRIALSKAIERRKDYLTRQLADIAKAGL
jgi:hypothetical protein